MATITSPYIFLSGETVTSTVLESGALIPVDNPQTIQWSDVSHNGNWNDTFRYNANYTTDIISNQHRMKPEGPPAIGQRCKKGRLIAS